MTAACIPQGRVLALVHADHVAIHADGGVRVRVVRVPYLRAAGAAGEIAAEEWVEGELGPAWADLIAPRYQRATEDTAPLCVAEIVDREADRWMWQVWCDALARVDSTTPEERVTCEL